MNTYTDEHVSILHRTFFLAGKHWLCIAALAGFSLESGGDSKGLLTDQEVWAAANQALDADQLLDPVMPKPQSEVLAAGKCLAPGGQPVRALTVSLRTGAIFKELIVFGNRRFTPEGRITEPEPFTAMDMSWGRACGGPGSKNPDGCTVASDGRPAVPPNVENPRQLMVFGSDSPEPAGLGPLGASWPKRLENLGTFDEKWRTNSWPGLPDDFDFSYCNQAPEDQRFEGDFTQGQEVEICGMNAEHPRLIARLPKVRVRVFALRRIQDGGEDFLEISVKPDTLWLFPNSMAGVVIYRGRLQTADDESSDVAQVLCAHELQHEPERPLSDYHEILRPREAAAVSESSATTMAPETQAEAEASAGLDVQADAPLFKAGPDLPMQHEIAALQTGIVAKESELDSHLLRYGIDRKALETSFAASPELLEDETEASSLKEVSSLEERAGQLATSVKKKEAMLQAALEKLGVPADGAMLSAAAPASDGPGTPSETIDYLKSYGVNDQQLFRQLRELEEEHAALQAETRALRARAAAPAEEAASGGFPLQSLSAPPVDSQAEAAPAAGEEVAASRACPATPDEVEAWASERKNMAGCDLSGFDLSGRDLSGAMLAGSVLENANLSRADLSDADLTGARMAGVNMSGASMHGVKAPKASLPRANLRQASLVHAVFSQADMNAADATQADFSHCDLSQANLAEAVLQQITGHGLKATGAVFAMVDCSEADLRDSTLAQADFSDATMTKACLCRANLLEAMFYDTQAQGADFSQAHMVNSRADGAASFKGATLKNANLEKAAWLGVDVSEANLGSCQLENANMAGCTFVKSRLDKVCARWANLAGADCSKASFLAADLFEASMRKAVLASVDLRWSSLYGADLYMVSLDQNARLEGANLKATLLQHKVPA